jgi:lauroyl/myristoyl acyltransferase
MRRDLLSKIAQAMPGISDQSKVARIGRQACISATKPMLDLLIFGRHREEYMRGLHVEGWENIESADGEGKGVLLLFIHIGAYGTSPIVMNSLGKPFTPVMFRPEALPVPRSAAAVDEYAVSLGCDPISPMFWAGDDTIAKVRESLDAGHRVGFALDVVGNHVVDFLGRPAALAEGIAHFACDTGAPIVPFCLLYGRDALEHHLRFYQPLAPTLSDDRDSDVESIMQEAVKVAESMIGEAPGQWMSWFGLWHWWNMAEGIEALRSEED